MLLKSYHCIDLEEYFWETLSLKQAKFSDSTHWVMWFKKIRISSISIVMEWNLLVSWLHIKSHQYFTIANESKKRWGVLGSFMSLRIEAAFIAKFASSCNKLFNIIIMKMLVDKFGRNGDRTTTVYTGINIANLTNSF